jgi:hypothetical protein
MPSNRLVTGRAKRGVLWDAVDALSFALDVGYLGAFSLLSCTLRICTIFSVYIRLQKCFFKGTQVTSPHSANWALNILELLMLLQSKACILIL